MWVLFNEVCLAAREVTLRVVKSLRSEVSADVGGTLHFTAPKEQLHYAIGITSLGEAKLHGTWVVPFFQQVVEDTDPYKTHL